MTCRRLRRYFEDSLGVNADVQAIPAEVVEHLKSCSTCTHFIEAQTQLGANLRLLRNFPPPILTSLDVAVLANYRTWMSQRRSSVKSVPLRKRISPLTALAWAAAVSFAIIVACGATALFWPPVRVLTSREQQRAAPTPKPSQLPVKSEDNAALEKPVSNKTEAHPHSVKRGRTSATVAQERDLLPPGFRTLMYCDQLSCSGDMQVIRVQVPSRALGLLSASAQGNDVISADVLVGSDGIARGIRIAE
jgi:hypothetical protein